MNSLQKKDNLEKGVIPLRFVFWPSPQQTNAYMLRKVENSKENLQDSSLGSMNLICGVLLNWS